jgi:hypothetical protein
MTQPTAVSVRRVDRENDLASDIRQAETVAKLLDSQFSVAGISFGIDAIAGLVPVVGDAITTMIGFYPIFLAKKHNLGRVVIGRMLLNLGIDFATGLVPVVGDAVDIMHKANLKNLALLKKAAAKKHGAALIGP